MKKLFNTSMISLLILTLLACSRTPEIIELDDQSTFQAPTVSDAYLPEKVQDGMILHAWNWSLSTIESELEAIAIAGFRTIQISPLQPQKDYFGAGLWGSNWWKLYQPLGFTIATENHSLGTLEDLVSLTEAAEAYGIRIIVDVVANHLAGGTNESLNSNVSSFEPEIYNQNLIRTDNGFASDSSIFAVTRGAIGGFPDLKTEHPIVQSRVIDLLKAYVDAGVSGFRFDAAKHIETPEDGDYASDFWPNVINAVQDYANNELYIYGEILNTVGHNRSYSAYTPYMGITINQFSDGVRNAVRSRNLERLETIQFLNDVPARKTVLWAESHDDYAGGHTHTLDEALMTKTYAILASRKDATVLYFARPLSNTLMGDVGTYTWQSKPITEINRFNNFFVGTDEFISTQDGYYLNERFNNEIQGVVMVNIAGERDVRNITVTHLTDGHYRDYISGNIFTVTNGRISGRFGESDVAVIYFNPNQPLPATYVSDQGLNTAFMDTKSITLFEHNTTSAYYRIDSGELIPFENGDTIELSHPDINATITLTLEVWFEDFKVVRTYQYIKSGEPVETMVVENIDLSIIENNLVVAWTWPEGSDGQWVQGTLDNDTFTFNLPENHNWFLLVTFPPGTTQFSWDNKLLQTQDIFVPWDGIFDGRTLVWN